MADTASRHVLTEAIWPAEGAELWAKRASSWSPRHRRRSAICAKVKVPVWPSPVAISLGTFAVLTIGAAYGPRLGLATISAGCWSGRSASTSSRTPRPRSHGLAYMMGATGGYLVGYLLAALVLGFAARRGWDRSVGGMALAMLVGNVAIYVPGAALARTT